MSKTPFLDGMPLTPAQRAALLAIAADGNAKVHGRTHRSLLAKGIIAYGSPAMGFYVTDGWGTGLLRELRRIARQDQGASE